MDISTRERRAYAIENALVVTMIGSAVALQIMKRKYGRDNAPLLVRIIDDMPGDAMPWPLGMISELIDHV